MKSSVYTLSALATLTLAATAGATGGATGVGGAGSRIEAAFRQQGYEIIDRISRNPKANSYCTSKTLETALDQSRITVVGQLIDLATGQPIQSIVDAWTTPHSIQLLQDSWLNLIGIHEHPYREAHAEQLLILHEMYRATGTCDDENFKISEKVFALLDGDSQASDYSVRYELGYPVNNGGYPAVCDRSQSDLEKGATANCFTAFPNPGLVAWYENTHLLKGAKYVSHDNAIGLESVFNQDEPTTLTVYTTTVGQMKEATTEHPFVVIHDIQSGEWTYYIQ